MIFDTSYYNKKILTQNFKSILDYTQSKNEIFSQILGLLTLELEVIPSGHRISLCPENNPNIIKFLWINKKDTYSLWSITFKENQELEIEVQVISSKITQQFQFNQKFGIPDELSSLLFLDFSMEDTELYNNPEVIEKLYISDDFKVDLNHKYDIFHNSDLKNHTNAFKNKFKTVQDYDFITFHYYDGPLSGISIIDNKFYFYFVTGYWDIWVNRATISFLISLSEECSQIVKQWYDLYQSTKEIYEYNKKNTTYHNSGTLDLAVLFLEDNEKILKSKNLLKMIELEHDKAIDKKDRDFYLLY